MPVTSRLLKTIHSKKYGVDQICFTHHTSSVVYSSKNGWDGKVILNITLSCALLKCCLWGQLSNSEKACCDDVVGWDCAESLRYLSLYDNRYLRYFKGHRDRSLSPFSESIVPLDFVYIVPWSFCFNTSRLLLWDFWLACFCGSMGFWIGVVVIQVDCIAHILELRKLWCGAGWCHYVCHLRMTASCLVR